VSTFPPLSVEAPKHVIVAVGSKVPIAWNQVLYIVVTLSAYEFDASIASQKKKKKKKKKKNKKTSTLNQITIYTI
jgi:hypothetical protein